MKGEAAVSGFNADDHSSCLSVPYRPRWLRCIPSLTPFETFWYHFCIVWSAAGQHDFAGGPHCSHRLRSPKVAENQYLEECDRSVAWPTRAEVMFSAIN
jgi:hypothetical protein